MCDNRKGHTSKSALKLRDGFVKKPGKTPLDPNITSYCHIRDKCPAEASNKSLFTELFGTRFRWFGPRHVQVLKHYKNSAICYSVATILATIYICEWKDVLQYLPFYNGKYKEE